MAGPPARAKAEGGGLQLAPPRRRGGHGEGPLCASHCALRSSPGTEPAPSPLGPAGQAPPFGSSCRHFVDAQTCRACSRAVVLPPLCPSLSLPGLWGHQGLQVLRRPVGTIKA